LQSKYKFCVGIGALGMYQGIPAEIPSQQWLEAHLLRQLYQVGSERD
jgi:hypothetical protein